MNASPSRFSSAGDNTAPAGLPISGSAIWAPDGSLLACAPPVGEAVVVPGARDRDQALELACAEALGAEPAGEWKLEFSVRESAG